MKNRSEYLLFALAGDRYAVDMQQVRELRGSADVAWAQNSNECVRGVLRQSGAIVPVMDLRMRFNRGKPFSSENFAVVVLRLIDVTVAIAVDAVLGRVDLAGRDADVKVDGHDLVMLDVERLWANEGILSNITRKADRPSDMRRAAPSNDGSGSTRRTYLGRQAIFDRDGNVEAYELLFRAGRSDAARAADGVAETMQALEAASRSIGIDAVLGRHAAYLNVGRELLMSDAVQVLPPDRFVLEILETTVPDDALLHRCQEIRHAGFKIALNDVSRLSSRLAAFMPYTDIVKIDMRDCPRGELSTLARAIRQQGKVLVAEQVETKEDYADAKRNQFDLFQGLYFAQSPVLHG